MEPASVPPCALVITQPIGVNESPHFVPMEARSPKSFVAAVFHRREADRAQFLRRLRTAAGTPLPDEDRAQACTTRLSAEYRAHREAGDHEATVEAAVRWWTRVQKATYHAYRLRVGVDPYVSSCLIAFDELDERDLRSNAATAVERLQADRRKVMRFFGFSPPGA